MFSSLLFSISLLLQTLVSLTTDSSFYELPLPKADGTTVSAQSLQGKKVVIVTLPTQPNANSNRFLEQLDSLARVRVTDVIIVGVPMVEGGAASQNKEALMAWYQSKLGDEVVVLEGMPSRKASKNQHPLFAWLTHQEQNGHFDEDITGTRQLFFISRDGALYGSMEAGEEFPASAVQKMLNR